MGGKIIMKSKEMKGGDTVKEERRDYDGEVYKGDLGDVSNILLTWVVTWVFTLQLFV